MSNVQNLPIADGPVREAYREAVEAIEGKVGHAIDAVMELKLVRLVASDRRWLSHVGPGEDADARDRGRLDKRTFEVCAECQGMSIRAEVRKHFAETIAAIEAAVDYLVDPEVELGAIRMIYADRSWLRHVLPHSLPHVRDVGRIDYSPVMNDELARFACGDVFAAFARKSEAKMAMLVARANGELN